VTELTGWTYAGAFVASLALSWWFTPLALRVALRKEVLDHPGSYKVQASPVPYLGGVAIVAAFSLAVVAAALVVRPIGGVTNLSVILGMAFMLSLMGLIDDLWGLPLWPRLVLEIGAGAVVWAAGLGVQLLGIAPLDAALTIVWVVGVTNAFNLLDNMDGLSAGVAAIAAGSFFILAAINGQFLVAALAISLAGCALGFLRHNFHPARIYMGDAGSLFLGFMIAVIGIQLRFDAPVTVTFMVPIIVVGVAIFDTTLVVTTRLIHRLNPMRGGRDHVSHRLVFVGIPVPAAVTLVYAAGIALGWLAVVMSRLDDVVTGGLLMGFVVAFAVMLGVLLARVPVYETSPRRRAMVGQAAEAADSVEVTAT
jgi:UDP-GlcNAc:undecaprenyl-phosphate/decaprenyl-phosphate GlcNAc-1-phosphate transferase